MNMRWGIALAVLVFLLPASAQVRGTVGLGQGFNIGFVPTHHSHSFVPNNLLLSAPYFYPGYGSDPIATQAQPPQVLVIQVPAASTEVPQPPKPDALLIEWQGDRYVRVTGREDSSARSSTLPLDYSERGVRSHDASLRSGALPAPTREVLPVVLVFRDGRQEVVSSYTIVGTALYAAANPWQGNSWTKKVQLTNLDITQTLRLNQERGVAFALPAGPNQVITSF